MDTSKIVQAGRLYNYVTIWQFNMNQGIGIDYEPDENNELRAEKTHGTVNAENNTVPWTITFTLPKGGYDSCRVKDYLPKDTWTNQYADTIVGGETHDLLKQNVQITAGDGRPLYYGIHNDQEKSHDRLDNFDILRITFYKDEAKTTTGIAEGNADTTVTISYSTKFNEDWMESSARRQSSSTHTNTADVKANNVSVKASSSIDNVYTNTLNKRAAGSETVNIDGVEYPIYKYIVSMTGVRDTTLDNGKLIVTDEFPSIFKIYDVEGDGLSYRNVPSSDYHVWIQPEYGGHWNREIAAYSCDGGHATFTIDPMKNESGDYLNLLPYTERT